MTFRRSLSLRTRFGITSLLLMVVLGVVLGQRLSHSIQSRTITNSIRSAEIAVNIGVTPFFTVKDLSGDFVPLDQSRIESLNRSFSSTISQSGIVRFKLWNRSHWLVYSDNPNLVGRWFAPDDQLTEAFGGRSVSKITNLSAPEELEERNFGELLSVYVPLRSDGAQLVSTGGTVIGAFEIYLPYRPIAAAIQNDTRKLYVTLAIGLLALYLALFRLVDSASRRLRRQAVDNEHQATHDTLTDLPNRRSLVERLASQLADPPTEGSVVVLRCDLDRFSVVNDTLGQANGDLVLHEVAARLVRRFQTGPAAIPDAFLARLGGGEFVIVATLTDDQIGPASAAVAECLDESLVVEGIALSVTASTGIAISPLDGDDVDILLRHAELAMREAKRTHVSPRRYSSDLDRASPERLRLAGEVRDAIGTDQFTLVYQPKVGLRDMSTHGVEALVRWNHPERGLVRPDEFLPVVENTELIGPLTVQLLDIALQQWSNWKAQGIDLSIAVNLSARNVADPQLVDWVSAALQRHGAPASALELELTESAVLSDPDNAASSLQAIRDLGVRLSVDDFGTGYASLAYLTTLPVDVLKIDQSFAGRVTTDSKAEAIVRFTVDLARQLELTVVAEGVEDGETLAALIRLGCDVAQGYHLSRPISGDAIVEWMRRPSAERPVANGSMANGSMAS